MIINEVKCYFLVEKRTYKDHEITDVFRRITIEPRLTSIRQHIPDFPEFELSPHGRFGKSVNNVYFEITPIGSCD